MPNIVYREAKTEDIPFLAQIRAANWETEDFWNYSISSYLNNTRNPQKALKERVLYVALVGSTIVGFIAGHLTTRYDCQGELEWIDVVQQYRRDGIASKLIKVLAAWFIKHKAYKVCIDPGNEIARKFYAKNGAKDLNDHWMYWNDIRSIS
jgi:GNAT superfamily N-acetyltransferase